MALHIDVYGRPKFRMRLAWFFGLVSKEVSKAPKKPEEKKTVTPGKRKRRGKGISARTIFKILRTKGLLKQLKGLLLDVLKCFKIRELRADFRVGLDNPADTGLLFALIGPAIFFLSRSVPCQIRVQPSFEGEAAFQGYLHGAVRLRPIRLVTPIVRFAFSLAAIRVVKILVLARWKRKK